jgi:hypothetical protein
MGGVHTALLWSQPRNIEGATLDPFFSSCGAWEIRPLVLEGVRGYFAVNPAPERTSHGPDVNLGLDFVPAVKVSYNLTKAVAGSGEHYADYGSITNIACRRHQQ